MMRIIGKGMEHFTTKVDFFILPSIPMNMHNDIHNK